MTTNETEGIKIIIADDHSIFRVGLMRILKQLRFIDKITEAQNGVEVLDILSKSHYDVVFMDIEMPYLNGIQTLTEIRKQNIPTKVIALSMFSNENYVLDLYEKNVNGYLLKNTNLSELKRALELVMEDEQYFCPEVADKLFKQLISRDKNIQLGSLFDKLSEREKEILKLICKQNSSAEIAEKLFISENTVKKHRQSLIEKTKSKNLVGVVLYAIRNGLVTVD